MTLGKSRMVYARQRNGFEKDVDGWSADYLYVLNFELRLV